MCYVTECFENPAVDLVEVMIHYEFVFVSVVKSRGEVKQLIVFEVGSVSVVLIFVQI